MFLSQFPVWDLLIRTLILGPVGLVIVIVSVRIVGLRSFSKMTAFDFVITVAIGSLLAGAAAADQWPVFIQNTGAIFVILVFQIGLAMLRKQSGTARALIENDPILLVRDGVWCKEAMRKSRVSRSDIWAKLREANVCDLKDLRAVVLESTGDISVLHADALDEIVLRNVVVEGEAADPPDQGAERLV